MAREVSAGGVVVRRQNGGWQLAVIEPNRDNLARPAKVAPSRRRTPAKAEKAVLALPKGTVDPGETPEQTALREVAEETGVTAEMVAKLGDIKYIYTRNWGDRARVFKLVSFFLLRYVSGEMGNISEAMKVEVRRAQWIPLESAARRLSYKGEREMVAKALKLLAAE